VTEPAGAPGKDRQERILDAVLMVLSRSGISGVSMRAVAREAGVALGLVNYHDADKKGLIPAALHRIEEQDVTPVEADPELDPEDRTGCVRRHDGCRRSSATRPASQRSSRQHGRSCPSDSATTGPRTST
jgi:AcrR family transcriptional regulator